MRERDEDRRGDEKSKKKKWKRAINWWYGLPRKGEWIRESIATQLKRKYTNIARDDNGDLIVLEELVYAHDGYRPHLENEKQTRKAFFHRGARVWRD
jgi:hypothetical protein